MQATTSNRFLLFQWVFFSPFYDRFLLQALFVGYRVLNRVSNHTTDYAAKRKYGIGSVKKQATQLHILLDSLLPQIGSKHFCLSDTCPLPIRDKARECFIKQERRYFHFFHYVFIVKISTVFFPKFDYCFSDMSKLREISSNLCDLNLWFIIVEIVFDRYYQSRGLGKLGCQGAIC